MRCLRSISIAPIICLTILFGCSQSLPFASNSTGQTSTTVDVPTPVPSATPASVSSPTPNKQVERDYFGEATSRADRANRMAQNAVGKDDWTLAVSAYQQAIDLLKQVTQKNINYAKAQKKLKEYQSNLASAQSKRDRPTGIAAATPQPQPQPQNTVKSAAKPVATSAAYPEYLPYSSDPSYSSGSSSYSSSSGSSSGRTYVRGYTRRDGTRVRGHHRSTGRSYSSSSSGRGRRGGRR